MTYYENYKKIQQESEWTDFFLQVDISTFMKDLDQTQNVYPNPEDMFRVFKQKPEDIKVLILGQDPYYKPGQANGLAFSLPENVKLTPTLRNIFQELESDCGIHRSNQDLGDWAEQGVFLLNTALSVIENQPNIHKKQWREFTSLLMDYISQRHPNLIVVLWGNNAKAYASKFPTQKVIESSHPSPLGVYRGFKGSKPFSQINKELIKQNKPPIKW